MLMLHDMGSTIRRIIDRDDLLHLAFDVADAATIVPERDRLGRTVHVGEGLLAKALQLHRDAAARPNRKSIARADHYECAASILEFCSLPGMTVYLPNPSEFAQDDDDAVTLYEKALAASHTGQGLSDRWRHVRIGQKLARAHRLAGAHAAALDIADRPDTSFNATGAGPSRGEFAFQWCAASLTGRWEAAGDVAGRRRTWVTERAAAYRRLKQIWQDDEAAQGRVRSDDDEHWTSHGQRRNRFEFACALIDLALGPDDAELPIHTLKRARDLAQQKGPRVFVSQRIAGYSHDEVGPATDSLSVSLALVEVLLSQPGRQSSDSAPETEIEKAIGELEAIRLSRHIIARSRGPFAIVLRRILGDLAAILSDLPGRRAAELGLHIALVAKHTGIAAIIRSQAEYLGDQIGRLVDSVLRAEHNIVRAASARMNVDAARLEEDRVATACQRALEAISPILASWVFPDKIVTGEVIRRLQDRGAYVLDFVGLGHTGSELTQWFRTLITPDGDIEFERVPTGAAFAQFFGSTPPRVRTLRDEWQSKAHDAGDGWFALGRELLPPTLLTHLAATGSDTPVDLLISPHGPLNKLPWQALRLTSRGPRLITRAAVTLSPVLTAVTGDPLPVVGEPALVRLVRRRTDAEKPLVLDLQQHVWGLDSAEDVVQSHCWLHRPRTVAVSGALQDNLNDCSLAHISAHGEGKQLEQRIYLPEEFCSYQAMQAHWPESVMLAACYLGDDSDEIDEEPLGFAIAVLIGRARCVVAARSSVDSRATDGLAGRIAGVLHDDPELDLAHALRNAQLAAIRDDDHDYRVYEWALFSAFVS